MERLTVLLALMALSAGGAETHVVSLAKELSSRGVNVLVASHGGRLTSDLEGSGIRHFTMPLDKKSPFSLVYSVKGISEIVKKYNVDIIHAHARIPAWVCHWVEYLTGCPYITTSHGIYSTSWGMDYLSTWGKRTIAVSEDVKAHLVKNFKVDPGIIHVIPNGIDLKKFDPNVDTTVVEKELGILPTDLKIVYISRLMGARGEIALRLIEALTEIQGEFPNVRLAVIGEGDKYSAIRQMSEKYNERAGSQKVIVTGARLDTPQLMNMADVAVGVGRVALEAMALKKPVIIAGEAGFMGVMTPDNFETARRHNFSGRGSEQRTNASIMAKSIIELLQNRELRKELGAFGRQAVERYFSIEAMTQGVLNVYKEVVEEENK